jgi:hypothetical protein
LIWVAPWSKLSIGGLLDANRLTSGDAMPIPLEAPEVLNREFLEIRAKLLEIAAAFDRLDRANGNVADDPRLAGISEALSILASTDSARAERIQLVFSRAYDDQWRAQFAI